MFKQRKILNRPVWDFEFWIWVWFVSDFELRISDFIQRRPSTLLNARDITFPVPKERVDQMKIASRFG